MIAVADQAAARAAVAAGRLSCPQPACAGVLGPWARARPRTIQVAGGRRVHLHPDRARCRECRTTQVMLPVWCLPRRAYAAEVVGTTLRHRAQGATTAAAAAAAQAPVATVRDWLRAVRGKASALIAVAVTTARSAGDAGPDRPPDAGSPLAAAVEYLARAARAVHLWLQPAAARLPPSVTGVDYLALIAERHRRDMLHRLRVADPDGDLASTEPWALVNVITAGRLLTVPR